VAGFSLSQVTREPAVVSAGALARLTGT